MKNWQKLYEMYISKTLQEEEAEGYEIEHPTQNQFILKKSTGEKYTVKKQASGNITCDCPGFKYNKTCKHIDIAKEKYPEEFVPRPRYPMSDMPLDLVHSVLDKYDPNWTLLGSGRRGKDTFKDIDILVDVPVDRFKELATELDINPEFQKVVAGPDIFRGYLKGFELDINRVNNEKQDKGAMLLYRTGPADLNTFMRQVAMGIGGSLSEKGLVDHVTNAYIIPKGASEEDYFKALGLPYLEPNKREHWRDYIDEEKYISEAREKQDKIVQSERWIWDLAKDYQKAMEAGEFSNTDNYLRKYAKKYAVSPTSREMNYAYNIALKRIGGSYKHSPRSKQGKEDRAAGLYASQKLGGNIKLTESIMNKLNEDDSSSHHPCDDEECEICSNNPELVWDEGVECWNYIDNKYSFHCKVNGPLGKKILSGAWVKDEKDARESLLNSYGEGRSAMVAFTDKDTQTLCLVWECSNLYADEEWVCDQLYDMIKIAESLGECVYSSSNDEDMLEKETKKGIEYFKDLVKKTYGNFGDDIKIIKLPVNKSEEVLNYELWIEGNGVT